MSGSLNHLFPESRPLLLLAPMQNVTDLAFWKVAHRYGGPDVYFTEYFRVHKESQPEKPILRCLEQNPSGRPAIAQIIGQSIPDLIRTAAALTDSPVAAIDLNVGCPAPIVCKKSSGGGLLRQLDHLSEILGSLRQEIKIPFTVKTRIGFHDPSEFDQILKVYAQYPIDALTVHGRTVKEMYRSEVHYDRIRQAVDSLACPVFANGNILSAAGARETARITGAQGLMVGRGAIRNPWIWDQIRELYELGQVVTQPTLLDLRQYIDVLYQETKPLDLPEKLHVAHMKKAMNFICQELDPENQFVYQIRRVSSEKEFFLTCDQFLSSDSLFDPQPSGGALTNPGSQRNNCY
ncbi:MAG: tRNA-dihydrouridine synthase family protein [Verrucomicrobiota bacterium]